MRIDATPSAWRDAVPLGSGTALRYTRSSCDGSGAQPISQGAAELPVPRIGARDTQYRRRKFAGQLHAKFARDARTVPPMPVVTCVYQPPGARSASVDRLVTGSVSHVNDRASRRSGPAGKALTMLLFGAASATGPAIRSRGGALNGPQGDDELF